MDGGQGREDQAAGRTLSPTATVLRPAQPGISQPFDPSYTTKGCHREESKHMNLRHAVVCILAAGCVIATSSLLPSAGHAQDAAAQKVKTAMGLLISKAEKLGPAKIEGTDAVADKTVP